MMTSEEPGLAALEQRVRRDVELVDHPSAPWRPDDAGVLDVLIVGAGQSGLATAFQLRRDQVTAVRIVERAPPRCAGPWRTFARMATLRSPKSFTGPDLGLPALTYRAWHEARFGTVSWAKLDLIPTALWADYLDWYARTLDLPVTYECALVDLELVGDLVLARLRTADGSTSTWRCRRVVLATGLDGFGYWWMPEVVAALPARFRAHAADAIDFEALAGKRVIVVGAGASAADNAATALEHGAAAVTMLCRRPELQRVQPYRWLTFTGFLRHLSDLDDCWRWRFMRHILALRESFPQASYDRCRRHAGFALRTGAAIEDVTVTAADDLRVATPQGVMHADFIVCGTGIDIDPRRRPELQGVAHAIACWSDRYRPEPGEEDERLGRYPYLASDYSLVEKVPGTSPLLARIHVFNGATTMSFGPSGASINAMTIAVPKLVAGITRALFAADVEAHWQSLCAYDEAVLDLHQPLAAPASTTSGPDRPASAS